MSDFWNEIRFFKPEEFESPDIPGSGIKMNKRIIKALDYARNQVGLPFHINSGYRSEKHNRDVGGVSNSQHKLGNAADVGISSQELGDSIEYWIKDYLGDDCGIGRYNTFIHVDCRNTKARWDNRT